MTNNAAEKSSFSVALHLSDVALGVVLVFVGLAILVGVAFVGGIVANVLYEAFLEGWRWL